MKNMRLLVYKQIRIEISIQTSISGEHDEAEKERNNNSPHFGASLHYVQHTVASPVHLSVVRSDPH